MWASPVVNGLLPLVTSQETTDALMVVSRALRLSTMHVQGHDAVFAYRCCRRRARYVVGEAVLVLREVGSRAHWFLTTKTMSATPT